MDNLSSEDLARKRKEALKAIIGKNKFTYVFSILTLVSLVVGLLPTLADSLLSFIFNFLGSSVSIKIKESTLLGLNVDSGYIYLAIAFAISTYIASKEKFKSTFYPILAWIVWLSVHLRTLNLPGLKDITTNDWTLGPDLDPWLFTRWAKEIVETGTLAAIDMMRYVPLGLPTKEEFLLHPYMIAWFHGIASFFGSTSVTHSAVLYPVFFFAITVIAFFLFTRKLFLKSQGTTKANIIALIASFFLTTVPSLIPRTIAGIPEKESAAFFFMFLAFYFFLCSWDAKGMKSRIILGILAGAATAGMALIWGGYIYILVTIGLSSAIAFLLGKINTQRIITYALWLITAFSLMVPFAIPFSLKGLLSNSITSGAIFVLIIFLIDKVIYENEKFRSLTQNKNLSYLPRQVNSLIIGGLLGLILAVIVSGFSFISRLTNYVTANLIQPAQSRLIQTVAENRQPFFHEWAGSFGPTFLNAPIVFWFFMIGSVVLFHSMIKDSLSQGARRNVTLSYFFFILATAFSRYSGDSIFNGTNTESIAFYSLGFIVFLGTTGYYYLKERKNGENTLKNIDYPSLLIITLFVLSLITARGAVRLIMVLGVPAAILTAYAIVRTYNKLANSNLKSIRSVILILVLLLGIFAGVFYLNAAKQTGNNYVPSVYNQQWQFAMSWVRDSTPQDSVFAHWWDYGYWLQGIGERATVLDGGNAISYWNHLMGRYALTGPDNREALEFLHTHDVTHFLIDSTDIGKYGAFSSIGSDQSYDRASFIPTINKNEQRTVETKNGLRHIYQGGFGLDQDIIYDHEGERFFLPAGRAGLAGVEVELDAEGNVLSQPLAIFVDQGNQVSLPMKYAFTNELVEFDSGIEAGIRIYPRLIETGQGQRLDRTGSLLYLSERTVKSQLARLYLYGEEGNGFNLAHSEDDFVIKNLKQQGITSSDFVNFRGFRGPIKIWEVNYPTDITDKEEFLETEYPTDIKFASR